MSFRRLVINMFLLTSAAVLTGCVHYEYDIVQPPELAEHIGRDADVVLSRSPLVYRLRSYENHLVIRIHNPTTQPITLLGGRSFAVDPKGESHPLRTQTIGPDSFIKLILPPLPPDVVPMGPSLGIGLGVSSAYPFGPEWYDPVEDPFWSTPRYYAVIEPDGPVWSWAGETNVRLSLTFAHGDRPPFTHEFVFHRKRCDFTFASSQAVDCCGTAGESIRCAGGKMS